MEVLSAIGCLVLLYFLLKCLLYFLNLHALYFTKSKYQYADFGQWAVVTGCTSGLGRAFARQLAEKGLNIVLVSRNEAKLNKVANDLKQEFGNIECKIVVIDFAKSNQEQFDALNDCIKDLQVGILVNNAGVGTKEHFFMDNINHNNMEVISCNVLSTAKIIEAVLPRMVENGKGLVINISSVAGIVIFGVQALYCASKRFLHTFSLALDQEYGNIIFQTVCPGFVVTNMTTYMSRTTSMFMPDADTFVKYCLRAIGKRDLITGYWAHELQTSLYRCLRTKYLATKSQDHLHARARL